jgi:hypothetical protein
MLDPSIVEIYRQTNYQFGDILLKIDKKSCEANSLLQPFAPAGGVFITAWNPMGDKLTAEVNRQANQKLKTILLNKGLIVIDGYGESEDSEWREDSFFAYPIDKGTSLNLCCSFEQNAVLYVTTDGLPTLLLNPNFA